MRAEFVSVWSATKGECTPVSQQFFDNMDASGNGVLDSNDHYLQLYANSRFISDYNSTNITKLCTFRFLIEKILL